MRVRVSVLYAATALPASAAHAPKPPPMQRPASAATTSAASACQQSGATPSLGGACGGAARRADAQTRKGRSHHSYSHWVREGVTGMPRDNALALTAAGRQRFENRTQLLYFALLCKGQSPRTHRSLSKRFSTESSSAALSLRNGYCLRAIASLCHRADDVPPALQGKRRRLT
jgi:hypothetical protein